MTKPKTASELLKELETDPKYKRKKELHADQIHRLQMELEEDETGLVKELNGRMKEIRCHIDSVWDLVNSVNSYQVVYPILNRHLDMKHHKRTREGIIRALTAKDVGQNIKDNMLTHFMNETDPDIKWMLSNALKTIMPRVEFNEYPELLKTYKGTKNSEQGHSL